MLLAQAPGGGAYTARRLALAKALLTDALEGQAVARYVWARHLRTAGGLEGEAIDQALQGEPIQGSSILGEPILAEGCLCRYRAQTETDTECDSRDDGSGPHDACSSVVKRSQGLLPQREGLGHHALPGRRQRVSAVY